MQLQSSSGDFCFGWQQLSDLMAGGKRTKPPRDDKKERSGWWEWLLRSHSCACYQSNNLGILGTGESCTALFIFWFSLQSETSGSPTVVRDGPTVNTAFHGTVLSLLSQFTVNDQSFL